MCSLIWWEYVLWWAVERSNGWNSAPLVWRWWQQQPDCFWFHSLNLHVPHSTRRSSLWIMFIPRLWTAWSVLVRMHICPVRLMRNAIPDCSSMENRKDGKSINCTSPCNFSPPVCRYALWFVMKVNSDVEVREFKKKKKSLVHKVHLAPIVNWECGLWAGQLCLILIK